MLTDREQKLVNWLRTRKVATMRHLQHQFQICHMTVFLALKKVGYHTSYNRNAGYYTLADVPKFDDGGLWAYRDVRFSLAGTLLETLVALATQAPAGLTVGELEERLQTPVANLLSRLVQHGRLQRQVLRGRHVVYLSPEAEHGRQQWEQRQQDLRAMAARHGDWVTRRLPGPAGHRRAAADDPDARRWPRTMGPATSNARPAGDGRASSPSAGPRRAGKKTTELSVLARFTRSSSRPANNSSRPRSCPPRCDSALTSPGNCRGFPARTLRPRRRRRAENGPPDRGQPGTWPVSGMRNRASSLHHFASFDEARKAGRLADVDMRLIDKFRAHRRPLIGDKSMHHEGVLLKRFLGWCRQRKLVTENPLAETKFRRPRPPRREARRWSRSTRS